MVTDFVPSQPSTDKPHFQAKQSFFKRRPMFTSASGLEVVGPLQIPKEKGLGRVCCSGSANAAFPRRSSRSRALGAAKGEVPRTRFPHT